jgi:hypothetical protein
MNYSVFEVFRIGIGPSSSHKRLRSAGWRSSTARGWRSTRWSGDGGTMRM